MRLLKFLLCLVVSFRLGSFRGCKKTESELDGTTGGGGQSTIKYSEGLEFVLTSDGEPNIAHFSNSTSPSEV